MAEISIKPTIYKTRRNADGSYAIKLPLDNRSCISRGFKQERHGDQEPGPSLPAL